MTAGRSRRPRRPRRCVVALTLLASACLFAGASSARAEESADPQARDTHEGEVTLALGGTVSRRQSRGPDFGDGPWGAVRRALPGTLAENLRLGLDVVSRAGAVRGSGRSVRLNAVAFDLHKVFTGLHGDVGTLLLQPYVVRRDNAVPAPPHTDGPDDVEVGFHDFHFTLPHGGRGRTNFRVGHFDVPFGLEPSEDTHFTLRQLIPVPNLGFKKDWGVSLSGALPTFDYAVAATRGSGREIEHTGENYAFSARVGTPGDDDPAFGLSALAGQIYDPRRVMRWRAGMIDARAAPGSGPTGSRRDEQLAAEGVVRRWRVGADLRWQLGAYTVSQELSGGRDFDQHVVNSLSEVRWTSRAETVSIYGQAVVLGQDRAPFWDHDLFTRLGLTWTLDEHWSASAEYRQDFATFGARPEGVSAQVQLRFEF